MDPATVEAVTLPADMAAATTAAMEVVIMAATAVAIQAAMVVAITAAGTEEDPQAVTAAVIPAVTAGAITVAAVIVEAIPVGMAGDTPAVMVVGMEAVITGAKDQIWLNGKPHRKLNSGGVYDY